MKKFFIISIFFLMISCEREGELTKNQLPSTISDSSILKYTGSFMSASGYSAAGEAKIFLENTTSKLKLEKFSVSSGPDLKIYLSKSATANDFVTLGNLTSATVYEIPKNINITDYSHVLIYCQQFSKLFGVAELIKN